MSTAASSGIEWTDRTWNPVVGCTPVSPGCLNCYAATMARRLEAMGRPEYQPRAGATRGGALSVRIAEVRGGRAVFTGDVRLVPHRLTEPLSWRKPGLVFVNSMSDLFHEAVPFEFIDRVFAVMALCPHLTFQVLTKRPERMAEYLFTCGEQGRDWVVRCLQENSERSAVPRLDTRDGAEVYGRFNSWARTREDICGGRVPWPLPNVWLGTSVENQATADERLPHLIRCPAAVRFVSYEPALGPVDFRLPEVEWVHPEHGDDGETALRRVGVGIGDEFLKAHMASWEMPSHITSRYSGDGLWARGRVRVHHFTRSRFVARYTPKYGDADRGCVHTSDDGISAENVVCGQLRTGHIVGDPDLKFPIAKAPPRSVDWVIVGGESGPRARACDVAWIRGVVTQCRAAGVPVFVKQLGGHVLCRNDKVADWADECGIGLDDIDTEGVVMQGDPVRVRLRDRKGGDPAEWPDDLRVREWPARPAGAVGGGAPDTAQGGPSAC